LSGHIEFHDENELLTLQDFLVGFRDNKWENYIEQSIDSFEGPGKSIEYEYADFEEYIPGNSEGCEYETSNSPTYLELNLSNGKSCKFNLDSMGNYKYENFTIEKNTLIDFFNSVIELDSIKISDNKFEKTLEVDINSIFSNLELKKLKAIFDGEPNDTNEFNSEVNQQTSVKIFSQEGTKPKFYFIQIQRGLYKKNKIDRFESIKEFQIEVGVHSRVLNEFRKVLEKYIICGGSKSDFDQVLIH
jgi:hypothetical protein